jgi:glutamine amidotransferase
VSLSIVNFDYGNVESIRLAFARLGVEANMVATPEEVAKAERLVLPGVGAAGFAMKRIREAGLEQPLKEFQRPLIGICLGMQLMFESSDEADTPCLGLISGRVYKMESAPGRPVPHMGWSKLEEVAPGLGLQDGDYVYFAHSFACPDSSATAAVSDYGQRIPVAVRKGNLTCAQFHPERSSEAGARFLKAFLEQ